MIRTYRMIWQILTRQERLRFLMLFALTIVAALFDVLGIAVILPFLQVVADPTVVDRNWALQLFRDTLGLTDHRDVTVAFGITVFLVIVVGMIVRAFTSYAEVRFSLMRAYAIGVRLLRSYLHQPYVWFLSRNSAEFGQNLLSEVDTVIRESVLPAVLLLSGILVTLLIAGFLFVVQPMVAIGATLILLGVYAAVYLSLRGWLGRIGDARFVANRDRFHIVQEAMGGIKEVKVMGLEDEFLERFRGPAHAMAVQQTLGLVIGRLPRFALEGVCYGGFILMVLILVIGDGDAVSDALPILGLVGMAGMKLFPALQQIYFMMSSIRFSATALEKLHHSMTTLVDPEVQNVEVPPLRLRKHLELRNLRFSYPEAEKETLSGFSAMIPAKSTVGIVGGTGAGKTTMIDLILCLLRADSGEIIVDGEVVTGDRVRAWQNSLGYVPQHIFLSDDTVAANIAFGVDPANIDMVEVERAARAANLHDFVVQDLPMGYQTTVGERGVRLSGGQRQRIGIARALYHDPDVLILDEATSALDTLTERAVMEAVQNLSHQKTIIMIAHRLSTVRNCDTIFLMSKGKLESQGKYDDLLSQSETFRKMVVG
jgi:ABC-type multidrug transport system fused ATPase/permease subunit